MKKYIILSLFAALGFSQVAWGQVSQSLWVGQTYTCDASSAVVGLTSDISWTSSGSMTMTGSGFYRTVSYSSYVGGTAASWVKCTWKYRYYANDSWHTQSKTWYFTCKDNPLTVTPSSMTLDVGDYGYVSASLAYSNQYSGNANIRFSSYNSSIATVDQMTGKVHAVGEGTTYINVYSNVSANTGAYCTITVREVNPTSVSIPSSKTIYVGETETITPSLYPSNASTTYTWYSSNTDKATVSSGKITGKDEGTTQVYCTTANGLTSNTCDVTVLYRVPTDISVTPSTLSLPIGQSKTLSYSVTPSNARTTVTWSTRSTNISLTADGQVTAKSKGTAVVTATTDNGYSDACTITIPPDPDKVTLFKKATMLFGEKRKLSYTVTPSDAYVSLTWKSSDENIVAVSSSGELTAVAPGKSVVSVTTSNGKTASCEVEVLDPMFAFNIWTTSGECASYLLDEHPVISYADSDFFVKTSKISLSMPTADVRKFTLSKREGSNTPSGISMPGTMTLNFHETCKLDYTLLPQEYDIQTTLTWQSTNPRVAIVDNEGNVYATGGGETDIILTAGNGVAGKCRVTVPEPEFWFVVWLNDGSINSLHLGDRPVARYDEGTFHIVSSRLTVDYPAETVRKFTISSTEDGTDDIQAETFGRPEIFGQQGEITISGSTPNSALSIYNMSGARLATYRTDGSGCLNFSIADYPSGIYIVKSKTLTYKIIKR